MSSPDFGVITEQGYVGGQFGFKHISEEAKEEILKENEKKEEEK